MRTADIVSGGGPSVVAAGPKGYPQVTYVDTVIDPNSFYGSLRTLYGDKVLKTQLDQLHKQGSYDAFRLKWHPAYDVRRLVGGRSRLDGIPPSLFWESDVGKWIEAACYFLNTGTSQHSAEFEAAIEELVDMIAAAQQPDGYLNVYFTVVDPEGRFKNLRDMHEMYNAGHLLEGALAHYQYTGSRKFLDVMIKNVELFMTTFGPNGKKGYPGHPELELAVLRLHEVTRDDRHIKFAQYLLEQRGTSPNYFVEEAAAREDPIYPSFFRSIADTSYMQAHKPIVEQDDILGHSVRAFYLLTAAADVGGELSAASRNLWHKAVDDKMYVTGGFGSEPTHEGFSEYPHHLPQSTAEGGCYTETCASIAAMMTSERLLAEGCDGKIRDMMELAFHNAVLGGGSLDGTAFAYANKLATCADETATRKEWFEVCCCPPNLSRTLGMLGGYVWRAIPNDNVIKLDVYLFVSGTRTINLQDGTTATARMVTDMPWEGKTTVELDAPEGWTWDVSFPTPSYAADIKLSVPAKSSDGFLHASLPAKSCATLSFSLLVRLLAPHPGTGQDTLTVSRGPIVYVVEGYDNAALDMSDPHFEKVGLPPTAGFEEVEAKIENVPVILLKTQDAVSLVNWDGEAYRAVEPRKWTSIEGPLTFVPWFARANRGGSGRVRTGLLRAA